MSRTDKTNPCWLKIARGEGGTRPLQEIHRHYGRQFWQERGGICDLSHPLPVSRRNGKLRGCETWTSYYMVDGWKVWGRHPKSSTRKALGFEGRNRMLLRKLRGEWKGTWRFGVYYEDIDSTWGAPRNERHVCNRWLFD